MKNPIIDMLGELFLAQGRSDRDDNVGDETVEIFIGPTDPDAYQLN